MTPEDVERLFRRDDGSYAFARWGRPVAPVVFGVDEATLGTVKGAIEAVCSLAGLEVAETDPELGANLLVFFVRDWGELVEVPGMERLIDGLPGIVARLEAEGANRYRMFRFDAGGAIRAAFVFLRIDEALGEVPAEAVALGEAVQAVLLWGEAAFRETSPIALAGGVTVLRPEIAEVIRAAYDPAMPAAADDPSHALRLAARTGRAA